MGFWVSILTLTHGTTRTVQFSAERSGRTLRKDISWYSFPLETEWTFRGIRSLEQLPRTPPEIEPGTSVLNTVMKYSLTQVYVI